MYLTDIYYTYCIVLCSSSNSNIIQFAHYTIHSITIYKCLTKQIANFLSYIIDDVEYIDKHCNAKHYIVYLL